MEEKFVFKNKGFRRLCIAVIIASCAFAAAYLVLGFINLRYSTNWPRFYLRSALLTVFTVELSLFAHRLSIYLEIGGDYSMARRSGAIMIVLLCCSAIVEAYYVSVYLSAFGRQRLIIMCGIIAIGFLALLPLVMFQYLNFNMNVMLPAVILGTVASLMSFFIGLIIIGLRATRYNGSYAVLDMLSRGLDCFAPIYISYLLVCVLLIVLARIIFLKEMKLNAKLAPPSLGGDDEIDDNIEDL